MSASADTTDFSVPRAGDVSDASAPTTEIATTPAGEGAADRGALHVADVVVEKVAVAAASEVDGVGGASRGFLGLGGSAGGDTRPRVDARVAGRSVALTLHLSVAYPTPIRSTTSAARAHVRERVESLVALRVTRVDVDVAALTSGSARPGRVVR